MASISQAKNSLIFTQLALGMMAFGSATPVSKIVTDAMPVFVGSFFRVALGGLVLLPALFFSQGKLQDLTKKDWLYTVLIALFGMFGFTTFMLYGMQMIPGTAGAIIMSTTPAVTALTAIVFLKESPTWRKITAVLLSVLGVAIMQITSQGGGGSSLLLGSLLVFGAVCCEVVYTLLGRQVSQNADAVVVACLAALLSLPLFFPFALWQWPEVQISTIQNGDWAALAWYGTGTLALGTWLWYSGIKQTEGTVAAGFMGLMPVSALVLSYILLGEQFEWIHLLGFGTVFAGVLFISQEHYRHAKMKKNG